MEDDNEDDSDDNGRCSGWWSQQKQRIRRGKDKIKLKGRKVIVS